MNQSRMTGRVRIHLSTPIVVGDMPQSWVEVGQREAAALLEKGAGPVVSCGEWWINPACVIAVGPAPNAASP